MKKTAPPSPKRAMTTADAARIQSATARAKGGVVRPGSFPARAQRAAARSK
ncbi:hypothetical protein JGR64_00475 [Luteimonas sp. MC1572]|nr:hypothetical protein [Luteimonas sp. MC1572]QQO03295.1 hypothetical protein JGR64_00475 [Luteimonas sp. MC1572]